MRWLHKISNYHGTSWLTPHRYDKHHIDINDDNVDNIYQSSDFPWVFLGGATINDINTVQQIAGQSICIRFDVTDRDTSNLPNPVTKIPFHEPDVWTMDYYNKTQQRFNDTANSLVDAIQNNRCPIYVHCSAGINRSVSILAAALTKLTRKKLDDILQEMKSMRAIIAPQDPYYLLALEYSPSDSQQDKQDVKNQLEDNYGKLPQIPVPFTKSRQQEPVFASQNNWDNWPSRKGTGDDPHDTDAPPERTPNGDYVFYHGTDLNNATKILSERRIGLDNWGLAGINTTISNAQTYASIKGSSTKSPSTVLKIIVDKNWFQQQQVTREVGGNGKDSWLIQGEIPPSAIKSINIQRVRGDENWQSEYPNIATSCWLVKISDHNDVKNILHEIGQQQRGAPEAAMLQVQRAIGGGIMNPTIEHVGDLIHRMSERPTFDSGGYEYVKDKVEKTLRWMTSEYGFDREFEENLENNARYYNKDQKEFRDAALQALLNYANAHKSLRPVNDVQTLANDAAISLGERRFNTTVNCLRQLKSILDQGVEVWTQHAHRIN